MEGVRARTIVLTEMQREILEGLVRQRHCPQAMVMRAKVILAAAEGLENAAIARQLSCHRDLARRWRVRFAAAQEQWVANGTDWSKSIWTEKIVELLEDRPRCGAPPTFTAEQFCQIVAIACEKRPQECGRPVTHWTSRELADEAIQRQIVASISPRHVGRLLKYGGPQTAPGASLAQQPRPAGGPRAVPAAVQGGGRGLSGRPGAGSAGRAYDQHR